MAQDSYVPGSPASSGATFSNLQAGGVSKVLAMLIAANAQVTAPASQATVAVTGGGASGGSFPAGSNFKLAYTYSDGFGETGIGSSESANFTVAAGNKPRVTFNDTPPTGAIFRNIYITAAGGASGSEVLWATGIAVATTTFDLLAAAPQAPVGSLEAVPTVNTTGAANIKDMLDSLLNKNQCWRVMERFGKLVDNFISGKPVDWYAERKSLQHIDQVFASYRQICADINTLVAANPGTLSYSSGNVMPTQKRTFS